MSERAPAPSSGDRDRGHGTEARQSKAPRADRVAVAASRLGRLAVGGGPERERKARDVGRAAVRGARRDDRGR